MTAHDNPVLPSDRGPGAGRSEGDVLDVKDEAKNRALSCANGDNRATAPGR